MSEFGNYRIFIHEARPRRVVWLWEPQYSIGGQRVVVSTTAFQARVRGSFPGLIETQMFLLHPLINLITVVSLCDREVASYASDVQGLNFESCVWRAVLFH